MESSDTVDITPPPVTRHREIREREAHFIPIGTKAKRDPLSLSYKPLSTASEYLSPGIYETLHSLAAASKLDRYMDTIPSLPILFPPERKTVFSPGRAPMYLISAP